MLLPLLMNLGMFTPPAPGTIPDGEYGYSATSAAASGLVYIDGEPPTGLTYTAGVPNSGSDYIVGA